MDIDNIVNKIIRLLKNDYLFDIDDEEEYAIKSDIADILQGEHNELTTTLLTILYGRRFNTHYKY